MNTIPLWREFIRSPENIQEETKNGVILITFHKSLRPASVYSIISGHSKAPSKKELEDLGYAFDGEKLKRTSRFFWSCAMQQIADWCDANKVKYSYDIMGGSCLSGDGTMLQLSGAFSKKAWETFPIEYENVQAHSISFE